jgi:ferritin
MRVQFQEETSHALKIYDFVLNRSGEMKLEPIAAVGNSWDSLLHVFEETYKHECVVTDLISNCYEVAVAEKDHATSTMLQWFINEQAEEESNVTQIIDQIKLLGEKGEGIYHLDKELATRVFVDATQNPAA